MRGPDAGIADRVTAAALFGTVAIPLVPVPGILQFNAADDAVAGDIRVGFQGGKLHWSPALAARLRDLAPAQAILRAYRELGPDFLSSLDGQFALAVVDASEQRIILAVDPLGIERLTYRTSPSEIVFGYSAEQVARAATGPATLRLQSIFDYLVMHMVPAPDTVFAGVRKLRGGHCVVWEKGRLTEHRYWTPRFVEEGRGDFTQLSEGLHAALRTAVSECQPDEHTGAFLSGGLDSSTVAGVLRTVAGRPAHTFSIGFGYVDYDELDYARVANRHFGNTGHEYVIGARDIASAFPLIAKSYDEPFGNSSALPLYHCARFAREAGMDHLLAGDGGDELFAGNSRYARQGFFQRYQYVPRPMRSLAEALLSNWPDGILFSPVRKARNYVERASIPLPRRLEIWNLLFRLGPSTVLHPEFLAAIDVEAPLARMQEVWDSAPCHSDLNRMLFYDWQYTLADNDLRKVETMSRLAGIRVSYPMLHPAVRSLAQKVPPRLMLPGTRLRDFYKRAMVGFLPDAIITKPKHGFGLPFGLWLQDSAELRDMIFGNLSSLRARQIVEPGFLDRLLHLHGRDDAEYYGVFLWILAMLEQWMQEHRVSV
jgi:asparagine synthase (glutamine-hydrolysing)